MNILFWNLRHNSIDDFLAKCITENDIDIIVLSEYDKIDFSSLIKKLGYKYSHVLGMGGCEKITTIIKKNIIIDVRREQDRYVLYYVKTQDADYVLAGIHLRDRRNYDELERIENIGRLKNDIMNLEVSCKCKRTIIIGDFNANPYDKELLAMSGFNAVLFKDEIQRSETRTVGHETYRRFYNPILNFISEDTKMYGSFYYSGGSATPIWHCLDQVLVSKMLADKVERLVYLRAIENKNLIARVKPNNRISDHLPLLACIKER